MPRPIWIPKKRSIVCMYVCELLGEAVRLAWKKEDKRQQMGVIAVLLLLLLFFVVVDFREKCET